MKLSSLPNDISKDKKLFEYFTQRSKHSNYPVLFINIEGNDYPARVQDEDEPSNSMLKVYVYGFNDTISCFNKEQLSVEPSGDIFNKYISNLKVLPFFENGEISKNRDLECALEFLSSETHDDLKGQYCLLCPVTGTHFIYDPETKSYCTTVSSESVCAYSLSGAAILAFEWALYECGLCDD